MGGGEEVGRDLLLGVELHPDGVSSAGGGVPGGGWEEEEEERDDEEWRRL